MPWFNTFKHKAFNGTLVLTGVTVKVMLLKSSYVFDADQDFVSVGAGDLATNEVTGTGYTGGFGGSGRKSLAGMVITLDDANDRAYFDANDLTWAAINVGVVGACALIREVTTDADSIPIAFINSGFPKTSTGIDFVISWSSSGVLQLS